MKMMVVMRFVSRVVAGIIVSILLGQYLDTKFNTSPFITLVILAYAVGGSLYLLIRETGENRE